MDPFEGHQEAITVTTYVMIAVGVLLAFLIVRVLAGVIRSIRSRRK